MLDIEEIRKHPKEIEEGAAAKGMPIEIGKVLAADESRRSTQHQLDELRAQRNKLSAEIPKLSKEERPAKVEESKAVGTKIKELEASITGIEAELLDLMMRVPNPPLPDTPPGKSDADNVEVRKWGTPRKFDFTPKDHVELAALLGLVDFENPRKFAGSRSYALLRDAVFLEQAVLRFSLESVAKNGFIPVAPPIVVRPIAMEGTGFFPLGKEDAYAMDNGELVLCGTSEVSLVSLHREEILPLEALPIRYVGISPCFRREAGAAGRDTKGLYRVHQFMKVEQVVICENDPELSAKEHEKLCNNSEEILKAFDLPHRVARACTAELGMGQVKKYEIETWMPSRQAYSETHSCSNLHEFQSRRSNIRYRDANGKVRFAHTLNNTAIASPRILIPLLEHYQQADGSVLIPPALQPYMHGKQRIEPLAAKA